VLGLFSMALPRCVLRHPIPQLRPSHQTSLILVRLKEHSCRPLSCPLLPLDRALTLLLFVLCYLCSG
jgi:hypothetical protein